MLVGGKHGFCNTDSSSECGYVSQRVTLSIEDTVWQVAPSGLEIHRANAHAAKKLAKRFTPWFKQDSKSSKGSDEKGLSQQRAFCASLHPSSTQHRAPAHCYAPFVECLLRGPKASMPCASMPSCSTNCCRSCGGDSASCCAPPKPLP